MARAGRQELGGRIFVTLFLSPFLLVAFLNIAGLVTRTPFALLTLTYRSTPCDITRSVVVEEGQGAGRTFLFRVRYEYEAEGKRRVSEVVQRGYASSTQPRPAHQLLRRFPEGAQATCWVSPIDPTKAVLVRWDEFLMPAPLFLSALVTLLLGLLPAGVLWIVWFGVPALPKGPPELMVPILGIVMGGMAMLIGLGLIYVSQLRPWLGARAAQSWVATPCEVVESEVRVHTSEGKDSRGRRTTSTSYTPAIHYRYAYDGDPYRSDSYDFGLEASSGRAAAERIVKSYPVGGTCACFVNPAEPSEAVLDRSFRFQPLPIVFGLLFAGAGAVVMRLTWATRRRTPLRRGGSVRDGRRS